MLAPPPVAPRPWLTQRAQWLEITQFGQPGYWIAEILYVGVTGLAGAVTFNGLVVVALMKDGATSYKFFCLAIVLFGAAMFAIAPVADAGLCVAFGNPWGNLLSPGFLGCDIAFAGLLLYVKAESAGVKKANSKKKKA